MPAKKRNSRSDSDPPRRVEQAVRQNYGGSESARCQRTTADGRRCTLPLVVSGAEPRAKNAPLCLHHLRQHDRYPNAGRVAAELLGPRKRLDSATAINRVLSRLFALVARNRIPPRHAAILAYIGQLLLQSLPLVRREQQLKEASSELQDALCQALLSDAGAARPDAFADTGQPVRQNDAGSEAAGPAPEVRHSVVYVPAHHSQERP